MVQDKNNGNNKENNSNFENVHWADNSAQRVLEQFPNENVYTVASGITPSGYIHIGNFREVITTELVRRALEHKGVKTKFIYSWDSYDAFRKVPKDVPSNWEKYLRMPVGNVPNPFNSQALTYGQHFIELFEEETSVFNFPVEFQKQHEIQTSGVYANSIKEVLNNKHIVIEELNKYRGEDQQLPLSWWPLDVYDDITQKDTNEIIEFDGEYTITYKVKEEGELEGVVKSVNFKDEPRVKLRWKADWPMRWNHFKVCFEPGGKDHSTPGSSYTVGKEIVKRIFNREAPVYTMYDFVLLKGQGGKISSSKGGALRLKDVLEVYTPEMVLFLFAGTRPNSEIHISFDIDVIKLYEDFDKLERLYFGLEEEKNEKQRVNKIRQYELSLPNGVEIPKELPIQPSFRHLTVLAQTHNFEFEKIEEYYRDELKTDFDKRRLQERFECAKNWLEEYAPDEFKFSIVETLSLVTSEEEKAILYLKESLQKSQSLDILISYFKSIKDTISMDMKDFFRNCYMVLIQKEKGPKLSSFVFENKEKFLELLSTPYSLDDSKYEQIDNTHNYEKSIFSSLNLRTGLVVGVEEHKESENLLVVHIRVNQEAQNEDIRQIVFGSDNEYSKEDLIDKKVVVLTNLKYTNFKGVESQGMIVACQDTTQNKFGILFSDLNVGECLKIVREGGEEVTNSQEEIKKEVFLQSGLRAEEGVIYFEDVKIEGVRGDRNLTGNII
ncbi:MAG: lysine--tRNA ligase [Nanoarchaeota archaeon]|nr:lysine--tRNA ligase [Nanoarchaeota archaeon]